MVLLYSPIHNFIFLFYVDLCSFLLDMIKEDAFFPAKQVVLTGIHFVVDETTGYFHIINYTRGQK